MPSNTTIKFIDFNRKYLRYKKEINLSVERVFKRGWFIAGPELADFEKNFSKYLGVKYAIGVNSGTDAISIALRALGIGRGDEVITVSHTATPTVAAIRNTGARPVFVDISADTFNINPRLIERNINSKTKAIIPVHLYGYPADMDAVMKIAAKHKLFVVEDGCQAHGARYKGRMVGTIGDAGCFSFYPTKNLGAFGDAGAVVVNRDKTAEKAKLLRNFGESSRYCNKIEGTNSRLDELQAAFLNWEIKKLESWNARRDKIARLYVKYLSGLPIKLPLPGNRNYRRAWHLFVIQTRKRDALREFLKNHGIDTMVHYPTPVFKQPAYKFLDYEDSDLPVTAKVASTILSLPLYPELTRAEVIKICGTIKLFYSTVKKDEMALKLR